jgi:hypothetical protein
MSHEHDMKAGKAEAARYALLRRLLPAIRHDMAGALFPVGMMSSMLEGRLKKASPDMDALARDGHALTGIAREAALSSLGLLEWVEPKAGSTVALSQGVAQCLRLVSTELSLKGWRVENKTEDARMVVELGLARQVFMSALLALTDEAAAPAKVCVSFKEEKSGVVLSLELAQGDGVAGSGRQPAYRRLEWSDVEAIAQAESVVVERGANRVDLRCGLAVAGGADGPSAA